jgi:hypothetical protein
MPTERQLDIMMESDLEFGTSSANQIQSRGSFDNINKGSVNRNFTGKQCGFFGL